MTTGTVGETSPARGRGSRSNLERIPPKVRTEIVDRIRQGVPYSRAAVSCGVPARTFARWLQFGREEGARDPYRKFAAACDRAFAQWIVSKVQDMDEASSQDWRAALEMLKRRDPDNFAEAPQRIDATLTARPFVDATKLSLEEQRTLYELLQKAAPAAEELPKDAAPALLALGAGEQAP